MFANGGEFTKLFTVLFYHGYQQRIVKHNRFPLKDQSIQIKIRSALFLGKNVQGVNQRPRTKKVEKRGQTSREMINQINLLVIFYILLSYINSLKSFSRFQCLLRSAEQTNIRSIPNIYIGDLHRLLQETGLIYLRRRYICTPYLKGQQCEIFWPRFFSWICSIWASDFEAKRIFFSFSFSLSYSNISMNPHCMQATAGIQKYFLEDSKINGKV